MSSKLKKSNYPVVKEKKPEDLSGLPLVGEKGGWSLYGDFPSRPSKDDKPSNKKSSGNTIVNVGGSNYQNYRDYQEEREAKIKKDLAEAKKLETERQLVLSRDKRSREQEEDEEFVARKKSRWSRYNAKKNEKNERTNKDIIEAGGNYIAEDIIINEAGKALKPIKDAAGYGVNKVTDVVKNPKNRRMVKNVAKGALGVAQGLTKEIEKDMMAYAKAKAIMDGTGEYVEEAIVDREGNIKGYKRVFKQTGNKQGKEKANFGLQPAVQPRSKKGTLGTKKDKPGPFNNKDKPGIGKHRKSDVALTNTNKGRPTNHRRSGVKLVKSKLPTLDDSNSNEPNIFGESEFPGFEHKEQFHPLTHTERSRARFESTLPPEKIHFSKNRHATGVKIRKSNVRSGLNFSKNRHTTGMNEEEL